MNLPQDNSSGCLYIVATPIGNLGDISYRAIELLSRVDLILAEDTRHSKRLLNHYGISKQLRSCHQHNEEQQVSMVQGLLQQGQNVALISDAGTPLISDPGFVLVRELRRVGSRIETVPGPSSIIAALSVAGLPTDRFIFDGFLPAKSMARQAQLRSYSSETRTVVLLESSHRIVACVRDVKEALGSEQQVVIARELTKKFETVLDCSAQDMLALLESEPDQCKGEFVLLLAGAQPKAEDAAELEAVLAVLLEELPVKQAAQIGAKLTGRKKNEVYKLALSLQA